MVKNKGTSFLLVPNHAIGMKENSIVIESAEAEMLKVVRQKFTKVGVAAFVSVDDNSSLSGAVQASDFEICRLDRFAHTSKSFKVLNYICATIFLASEVRKYEMAYIFVPGHCGMIAALWARVFGIPYGLYVRGTWLDVASRTSFLWRRVFFGSRFMIVTGESFRRELSGFCTDVVNEVPLTAFKPNEIHAERNKQFEPMRLLFVGRLSEAKGVLDVIRALAILIKEGLKVELLIAGGGVEDELRAIDHLNHHLGTAPHVKILGHLTAMELADIYKTSGMFVFPSYYPEGFPRVLYEAMMFSLPIVTCEMPGTGGFLLHNINCLYCHAADPIDLANNLRVLIEDPAFGNRLASKARLDVRQLYESFNEDSHVEQLLSFLRPG